MELNIRKSLLMGTALVAVGAFAVSTAAQAQQTIQISGGDTFDADAPFDAFVAGDNIDVNSEALTINSTRNTTIGAITDVAEENGSVAIINTTTDVTQEIGSVTLETGGFGVDNGAAVDSDVAVTITGTTVLDSGALSVDNSSTGHSTSATTLTFQGDVTVGGATTVLTDGTGQTAVTSVLNLDGASSTFTGGMTVTGGADAASNTSSVVVSGAAVDFGSGLTLTDGDTGAAILTLDGGTTAQQVTGNIAGTGDINVANSAGATFLGTVGAGTNVITIEDATGANNSSATFQNTVNAATVTLGGAGTGTNTVTFDTTTNSDFTVTGTINGGLAAETNSVVVTGSHATSNTVTAASAWGGGAGLLNSLTVSGSATLAMGANNLTVDNGAAGGLITVGSDAGLSVTTGTIDTATIANAGTLTVGGATTITADITGAGTVAVTGDAGTIDGSIANAITVADDMSVTLQNTADDEVISGAITLNDSGIDDGVIFDDGTGTLTVSGAITAGTHEMGLITIADSTGTVAFTNDIGTNATTGEVGALNFAGASANTVTTTGNMYVDAIDLVDAANTLQFVGTSAQTVSGTIDGPGILTVGGASTNSDVTFAGTVGLVSTALSSGSTAEGSTARFSDDATITGAWANAGTTRVAAGATLTAGSYSGAGSVVLALTDGGTVGTLETSDFGNVDLGGGGTLAVADASLNVTGFIAEGTANNVFADDDLAADGTLSENSALITATVEAATGHVTIAHAATSNFTKSKTSANAATALNAVGATATGNLETVADAYAAAGTDTVDDVLEAVGADVGGGAVQAGVSIANQTANLMGTRLASLRDGSVATGMAAGSSYEGSSFWGQAFGKTGDQDERDNISGYDVDTYGLAFGVDTENLGDNLTVGLAFSYGDTEVDSKGLAKAKTEIDSYQLSLYGDYDLDDRTFISGNIGYIMADNDTTRNPAGTALVAKGNYDSDTIVVGAEVGREYMMGEAKVVPTFGLNYTRYDADSYTEKVAGANFNKVDSDALNMFEVTLGAEAAWDLAQADGSIVQPVVRLGVRHDLIGDEFEATNTLVGASAYKTKGFDPAQTTFDGGVGVTYFSTQNWDFTADYNVEYKSDYVSHAGLLKAAYNF
ncbi:MAG: autotransporter domain-containing protein [Alphaproteobacteria bacterium]